MLAGSDRGMGAGWTFSERSETTRSRWLDPLDHARGVIAAAEQRGDWSAFEPNSSGPDRWQQTVQHATDTLQLAQRQHARVVEHDLGLSL